MRLKNVLKICLVFGKSEPGYAYKRYAYKKRCVARASVNACCELHEKVCHEGG